MKARFIFSCLALLLLSLLGGCEIDDVSYLVDKARCNLRVGVLAETHLESPHSDRMFEKSLRYFKEREVDAVIFVGDVTQDGALAQWRGAKKVWDRVFPPGSRAKPIVVIGERDSAKVFEELTGEKYESTFACEIKGYTFIGANWKDRASVDAWALKPLLAKVDRTKPFFYIQQLIPYATCCPKVGRLDCFGNGKIQYMLSKFPNAIAICGASHTPLTDDSAFWHGDFTCVNAGSFAYAKLRGEDGAIEKNSHNGLVMSVYGSSVVFERIDFGREPKSRRSGTYVEKLGRDWRLDLPAKACSPAEMPAPKFWEDTRMMIFPSGKTVSVRFPPVLARHTGVRAYEYEVVVEGSPQLSKTVLSPACCASEEREDRAVSCDFARSELPRGEVRFVVTPINAFGKRGASISGEVQL